ncbi:MAG TPA: AraC family transcriptional regulator [Trebonia sp.]|jgi:AraC-like DNA-binding protein
MADFDARPLATSDTVTVWDVACRGALKHESDEECAIATHVVFPYRGVYVHHVGRAESVAEANQVIFINENEPYRVSHPVDGGDAALSIGVSEATLLELAPKEYLRRNGQAAFNRSRLRVGADTQTLTARLRHRLDRGATDDLEAESLTLTLLRGALGEGTSHAAAGGPRPRKLVDRAKLVLAADLSRRWTLAEIASAVGGSPVYLTQVFQQMEGMPLYRYHLQLRLARALALLGDRVDLTSLAFELGFSSHSHFSAAFKQAYGQTPSAFQRSARIR